MSDLFHPEVPDEYIVRVARVMVAADWHTYQVLTKRSERMAELLRTKLGFVAGLPHVWWGVKRREPAPRLAANRPPPLRTGRPCDFFRSSLCWKTSGRSISPTFIG